MRAIVIGDVHVSDNAPSSRTSTYTKDILDKLEWVSNRAVELNCDCIILAGDVFHIKSPVKNSHWLVQAVHKALTAGNLPVFAVPGNHDLTNDRLESISSQPLGALCNMKGVNLLIGASSIFPIFGIPWLSNWAKDLTKWMDDWQLFEASTEDTPLMITHAPLFPSYQNPPYEYISYSDWAGAMGNYPAFVYYGHIHDYYGVIKENGVSFCNQGALSRGSLHESSLNRKPAVTLWDSEAEVEKFQRIEVPHKPASEVFLLKEYEMKKEAEKSMLDFVEVINDTKISTTSFEEALAVVQSMEVDEEIRKLALQLLEEAD